MTNEYYNQLVQFQKDYPELTFNNNGYEYLSRIIREEYSKEIEEVSKILKKTIHGFSSFNNFKIREDGSIVIRVQYSWSSSFIGVGYFPLEQFKDFEEDN